MRSHLTKNINLINIIDHNYINLYNSQKISKISLKIKKIAILIFSSFLSIIIFFWEISIFNLFSFTTNMGKNLLKLVKIASISKTAKIC